MSDAFRTDAGRCVVEDGVLRLEPRSDGPFGTLRDALLADELPWWRRASIVLFFLALVVGAVAAVRLLPSWLVGAAAGLVAVALLRRWRERGLDETETIPLEDVVEVQGHAGVPLLTRPQFVIRYRDEGGVKHRHLRCPSRLYGFGAFETGRELFRERGLLTSADAADEATD